MDIENRYGKSELVIKIISILNDKHKQLPKNNYSKNFYWMIYKIAVGDFR